MAQAPKGTETAATGGTAAPVKRERLRLILPIVLLLVWLGIAGVGGSYNGKLAEVQKNDQASFLPEDAESQIAGKLQEKFTDSQALPGLVLLESEQPLTSEDMDLAAKLAADLPGLQMPVEDNPSVPIGDYLLSDQLPVIPSEDGKAALVILNFDAEAAGENLADGESVVRTAVATIRDSADEYTREGTQLYVTGPVGVIADLVKAFGSIDTLLVFAALGTVFVILLLVYRNLIIPFMVIFAAIFAEALAAFLVYWMAKTEIITLDGQAQGILSILVIGAATDYSLLLVARYREELTRTDSRFDAMGIAWRRTLEPVAASGGTVILGLMCLLLADLNGTRGLGPVGSVGIVAAMLSAMTFLPALLIAFGRTTLGEHGRWIFWPQIPRLGDVATKEGGVWARVAKLVEARPRAVWVTTALVLLAMAAALPTLKSDGIKQSDVFLTEVESVTGTEHLADHFPAGSGSPTLVYAPEAQVSETLEILEKNAGVDAAMVTPDLSAMTMPDAAAMGDMEAEATAEATIPAGETPTAVGPADLPDGLPAQGDAGLAADGGADMLADAAPGDTGAAGAMPSPADFAAAAPKIVDGLVEISVTLMDAADSPEADETVRALRAELDEASTDVLVGGTTAFNLDVRDLARSDRDRVIPVVLAVIFWVLVMLLRSLVAPLILILANVLSFAATLGLSAIFFNHVFNFPGGDPGIPLFGFIFLVALGIDYSIFLMTRVREEALNQGTRPGMLTGLRVTGGVITSAGVVLAATFAVLGILPLLFLVQLAFIVSVGVLIDTLIVRSLLVPALGYEIGAKLWWPVKLDADPAEDGVVVNAAK